MLIELARFMALVAGVCAVFGALSGESRSSSGSRCGTNALEESGVASLDRLVREMTRNVSPCSREGSSGGA